ncbi:hypothetical protein AVEN_157538-1 [Araneus ventricosus]|uniref:Uncharacterized protein n=1 Tax=Araneus ventricosus TaxID=182803 RepID=A0A4Y2I5E4_ARAVE|nr:hypothetical protein AVEN_157538-1 [Araneus ventricosus]
MKYFCWLRSNDGDGKMEFQGFSDSCEIAQSTETKRKVTVPFFPVSFENASCQLDYAIFGLDFGSRKTMIAFKCWRSGIFANLLRINSLCQYSTSLNPRVKLCEVPEVCSSEEWNSVVQESRAALQKLVPLNRIKRHQTSTLPMQRVIKRLQQSSRNSEYLINTFKYVYNSA